MKKIIETIVIGIVFGIIIAFLTGCTTEFEHKDKSAEELRNEYLKKAQEEKAISQKKERIRRGQLTYAEALNAMLERHEDDNVFTDIFRFYEQGHYYKAFYRYYDRGSHDYRVTNSSCGVVHDPDCPCHKSDNK